MTTVHPTGAQSRAAEAREDVCRFLAACYYEPDTAFEEEGMFASLREAAATGYPELAPLAAGLGEAYRRGGSEALLVDYARLFLGPAQRLAEPYGSVWLDDAATLMGASTLDVQGLYRAADFDVDEDFRELPDHVAVELEFLYLLLYREHEALIGADEAGRKALLDLRRRFLTRHLGAWIPRFASAVRQNAQCDFYRQLAELSEAVVGIELARLD
jgi:TorA maturation chaperone TorD